MSYYGDWHDVWPEPVRSAVLTGDPPVENIVRVAYTHPSFAGERPLLFESGTLTLDTDAVGFAEVNLVTSVPATAAELATLDPRTGTRIRLYAGYKLPGMAEVVHLRADVHLRERAVRRPENTMTLYAATDDAMLAQSVMLTGSISDTGLGEALASIIDYALPGTPTIDSNVPAGLLPELLGDLLPAAPGDRLWPLLASIADLASTDLWCDALGIWRLNYGRGGVGSSGWLLHAGSDGISNVFSAESVLTLEQGYANVAVISRNLYTNDAPPQIDYGTVEGALHWSRVGMSAVAESRTVKDRLHDWGTAAADIVYRSARRGDLVTIETPTAWWIGPRMGVLVHLPTMAESETTGYEVQRVTFDLNAGTMQVRGVLDVFEPIVTPSAAAPAAPAPIGSALVPAPTPTE